MGRGGGKKRKKTRQEREKFKVTNQHTGELISAGKTSHKRNNKDRNRLI